jgi:hypothetical protein
MAMRDNTDRFAAIMQWTAHGAPSFARERERATI